MPQLAQAWQDPARCIVMPHCIQIGASGSAVRARLSARSIAVGDDGGSTANSPDVVVATASSTPGRVCWVRSPVVKIPISERSSAS